MVASYRSLVLKNLLYFVVGHDVASGSLEMHPIRVF